MPYSAIVADCAPLKRIIGFCQIQTPAGDGKMTGNDFEGNSFEFLKRYQARESVSATGVERKRIQGNLDLRSNAVYANCILCGLSVTDRVLLSSTEIAVLQLLDVEAVEINLEDATIGLLLIKKLKLSGDGRGRIRARGAAVARIHCIGDSPLADEFALEFPHIPIHTALPRGEAGVGNKPNQA